MADLALDPVCGMRVDPRRAAGQVEHAGVTYWFCSAGCAQRFRADPARFLAPAPGRGDLGHPPPGGRSMSGHAPVTTMPDPSPAAEKPLAGPATGPAAPQRALRDYVPLLVVFALLAASTAVLAWRRTTDGQFTLAGSVTDFMVGFFLVFAGFKLIDLPGFAGGYATYDLLAGRVRAYGFVYPFIELGFGLAMLAGVGGRPLLWAEVAVMGFSGLGVALKLARKETFTCACLGTVLKVPLTKVTLFEDLGMAGLALLLLALG